MPTIRELSPKNGIRLAIVDANGKVCMAIAAGHKNPNARLTPLIERKV